MNKAKQPHEECTHNYQEVIKSELRIQRYLPSFYQSVESL